MRLVALRSVSFAVKGVGLMEVIIVGIVTFFLGAMVGFFAVSVLDAASEFDDTEDKWYEQNK